MICLEPNLYQLYLEALGKSLTFFNFQTLKKRPNFKQIATTVLTQRDQKREADRISSDNHIIHKLFGRSPLHRASEGMGVKRIMATTPHIRGQLTLLNIEQPKQKQQNTF